MNKRRKRNVSVNRLNNSRRITRSMSLSDNGNDISQLIPIDVLITIFVKLPLKSIARCRCVSKHWASILRRSDFTEFFLSRSSSRSPVQLFTFQNGRELLVFSLPQHQNLGENSSPVVPEFQIKFSFDMDCAGDIVHGLICHEAMRNMKICNPSTGQTIFLPKVKKHSDSYWCVVFGYDPIGKQFKVLAMRERKRNQRVCDEYQVLTVKGSGTMSWKMIECSIPHRPPEQKICINGVVYYTTSYWIRETCLLVCFDVRFEKFSFIKPTGMINFLETTGIMNRERRVKVEPIVNLMNHNGKLGLLLCQDGDNNFIFDGRSIRFKLWVLEDLEKQVWSEHTFLFPTVPENIVGSVFLNLVGMTQTNEIVFAPSYTHHPYYLYYFNLEKKTIIRVLTQGIEGLVNENNRRALVFLNHVENVKLY